MSRCRIAVALAVSLAVTLAINRPLAAGGRYKHWLDNKTVKTALSADIKDIMGKTNASRMPCVHARVRACVRACVCVCARVHEYVCVHGVTCVACVAWPCM